MIKHDKKKINFWGLEIRKKGPYVINILKISKIMEWQNFISKKKTYTYKMHNIVELFKSTQRAQCDEGILINIYISRYFRDIRRV